MANSVLDVDEGPTHLLKIKGYQLLYANRLFENK